MNWPTDDVEVSNAKLAPSKLKGGFVKKRKQPEGGFDLQNGSDEDSEEEKVQHVAKKHRALEQSAKKRPNRNKLLHEATTAVTSKRKSIDPRFMEYAGEYDKKITEKNYAFLDEMKKEEIAILKKASKRTKSESRQDQLNRAIQSREETLRQKERVQKKEKLLSDYKDLQKQQAKDGITPHFVNDKQLSKQLGMARDFLSTSRNKIDKRLNQKMERQSNKEKFERRQQARGEKK